MSGNEGLCVRVVRGGWRGMERRMLVLRQRLAWGQGSERRPRRGPTEGCSSQRGKRQTGARQQRAAGVWGRMRMEGWSGILRSDGREVAAPRDLAQIGPALGSSLSDAEVMECTCHPWC